MITFSAAIHCPPPLPPRHGRLLLPRHHLHQTAAAARQQGSQQQQEEHSRLLVGETVRYACKEGFVLIGEPVIRCTEAGLWSHSVPFCKSVGQAKRKLDRVKLGIHILE